MIAKASTAGQRNAFGHALARFEQAAPIRILTHNDADGLAAAALLARDLGRGGGLGFGPEAQVGA